VAIKNSLRSTGNWVKRGVLVATFGALSVLLAACGGGGTQGSSPTQTGTLAFLPETGSLYANNPFTITVAGGRCPYIVASNEQTLWPGNITLNCGTTSFVVTPNQPGVVDIGQDPQQVPSRKLNLTVRESGGTQANGSYDVLQNFLTGYSLSLSTIGTCAGAGATTNATQACSGSDSFLALVPVTNGVRYANKQLRFNVNYGSFAFILDSVGTTGGTLTATADTAGRVQARIRVLSTAPTSYAQFRMTDVATGAYTDYTFVIVNGLSTGTLSVLPPSVSISGPNATTCGGGAVDIGVIGGNPPFTASVVGSASNISVSPPFLNATDPRTVRVTIATGLGTNPCPSGSVLITDSGGQTATVSVTSAFGTSPPATSLSLSPATIACVPDGSNNSVLLVSGGSGTATTGIASSSLPGLLSVAGTFSGSPTSLTLTANGVAGAAFVPVIVTITDGSSNVSATVNRKTTCP